MKWVLRGLVSASCWIDTDDQLSVFPVQLFLLQLQLLFLRIMTNRKEPARYFVSRYTVHQQIQTRDIKVEMKITASLPVNGDLQSNGARGKFLKNERCKRIVRVNLVNTGRDASKFHFLDQSFHFESEILVCGIFEHNVDKRSVDVVTKKNIRKKAQRNSIPCID